MNVGSGVVGSIMSMELANAGLSVLCLERGRMIDPKTDFGEPDNRALARRLSRSIAMRRELVGALAGLLTAATALSARIAKMLLQVFWSTMASAWG